MTNNFTKAVNSFIDKIHCSKQRLGKSAKTSGGKFMITIIYNGKRCNFVFHDNFRNESNKKDFLYCLWLDADCFENCAGPHEFMRIYGYDSFKEAVKAYNACQKQSERLHRLFTDEEIALLAMLG